MPLDVRLLAAGFALVAALPCAAADASGPAEPSPSDWSGPWVGLHAGAGRLGGSGVFAGVSAGYAFQFERIVIGVEGDLAGGGLDARRSGGRHELDAFGGVRARVGYAFDRFVAYGTAGVAFASAEFARAGERDRETHVGWALGGGLEAALFGGVSARVEYLYVDLDRRDYDAGGVASFAPSGGLVRAGLNYRF